MAQPAYLWLKLDGNEIQGEPSVTSMDRENTIECLSFQCGLVQPIDETTGTPSERREHMQVTIQKPVDRSSPRLLGSMARRETGEATFRFYRTDPERGTEENFYTVRLKDAHVSSVIQESDQEIPLPMLEEVGFAFREIAWMNEIHGEEASDSWTGGR